MRRIAWILTFTILFSLYPAHIHASDGTFIGNLRYAEIALYGEEKSGSLEERITRIEQDVYGARQGGDLLVRVERIRTFFENNTGNAISLKSKLNLSEWFLHARVTDYEPLLRRLDRLELAVYGSSQSGSVSQRVDNIMKLFFGTNKIDFKAVEVPEQTLVKIRLLSEVDSSKSRVGETISYVVVEDVVVGNRVVIPAGAEGIGEIAQVSSAKGFGRDGSITIDFGSVPAFDGSSIRLHISERAIEQNLSLELALGASMAAVLLLGNPLGLVGGFFVKGKDVKIPAGTEFFVETSRTVTAQGVLF